MKVYIKNRKRKDGQFQFYMHQFVEAAIARGIPSKDDILFDIAFKLKTIQAKLHHLKTRNSQYTGRSSSVVIPIDGGTSLRKVAMSLYPYLNKKRKKKAVIVTSTGSTFFKNAFPFFYHYEIIPVLWDVWPSTWACLLQELKQFNCPMVFVTVRSMAAKISQELHIPAYWLPEGIDLNDYYEGMNLSERPIEVYELGRQKKEYHLMLEGLHQCAKIKQFYRNKYAEDGKLLQLAFPAIEALVENLAKTQILVSFPLIDTHPQKAGGLETLTQRYWEAMLSRCLIVGRAPQELIDFMGYDPIINVDWKNPDEQIIAILNHISDYQDLVDRNYKMALEKASWDSRITQVVDILKNLNFNNKPFT